MVRRRSVDAYRWFFSCLPTSPPTMSNKQLIIVLAIVGLLSAGLGVVITSKTMPKEVTVSLDVGGGEKMAEARVRANENAAIATLRSIATAQQQFQSSGSIDTDDDGGGEYAFFGEMAGTVTPRGRTEPQDPAYQPTAFGNFTDGGCVERQGYLYRIFLPGSEGTPPISAVGEAVGGGWNVQGPSVGSSNAEIIWCCYAWPTDAGKAGKRAFFINQSGDVTEMANEKGTYSGSRTPSAYAAFDNSSAKGLGVMPSYGMGRTTANDGQDWTVLR